MTGRGNAWQTALQPNSCDDGTFQDQPRFATIPRNQVVYLQLCHDGVPAFAVHADTAASLALQLCWQQAADRHAPDGYPVGQVH
jgi:hypothetical protein